MNNKLPEYIKVGEYIRVLNFIGRIQDIAIGIRENHIMLLVESPMNVFQGKAPEWVEYIEMPKPFITAIQPATIDDWLLECTVYMNRARVIHKELKGIWSEAAHVPKADK